MKNIVSLFLFFSLISCTKDAVFETAESNALIQEGVHDPAQLIEINGQLFLFASAVEWSRYAYGSGTWALKGDDIYAKGSPSWYQGTNLWAPSIIKSGNNEYRLYHSAVIDEDNGQSRIGFANINSSSANLSISTSTDFVLESNSINEPFAIDPAVFEDKDSKIWMVYGSHTKGIWVVEIDEATGVLKESPDNKSWNTADSRFTELANYDGPLDENNVEAAYIYNCPDID